MTETACLRCGTRIPVRSEMVGQVVLCPSCFERVYVTERSGETPEPEAGDSTKARLSLPPTVEAILRQPRHEVRDSAPPVALVVGLACGAALLLLVGALLALGLTSSRPASQEVAASAEVPPPPPAESASASGDKVSRPSMQRPASPPAPAPETPQALAPPAKETAPQEDPRTRSSPPRPPSTTTPPPGGRWAEAWQVPPLTVREPVVLTSLGDSPGPWTILVRAADIDPRLPQSIVIEPESTQTAWTLAHVTLSPPPAVKEPLARLTREAGDLKFAWLVSPNSSLGLKPLLNCMVEIRAGAERRVGQFRGPLQAAPLVLDLSGEKQVIPLPLENCPRTDKVSFEIVSLDGFPAGALLRGGIKSTLATAPPSKAPAPIGGPGLPRPPGIGSPPGMSPGALGMSPGALGLGPLGMASVPSPLVIEFPDLPGAEIRVRCIATGAPPTAKLELWVESVYRDIAGVEFPLSLKELETRLKDAKKAAPDAQEALVDAKKAIKRLQEKGEKLQKNKATPKRDRELSETKRLLDSNTADEAKLLKQMEAAQALLDVAPKLQTLISSLDKKAKLRYVLFVECGDPDLLLAEAPALPAGN